MPTSAKITIARVLLDDPDSDPSDKLFNAPGEETEDLARQNVFLREEWWYVGVIARATIAVPYGKDFITMTIDSPGLWGVESDSGEDYIAQIFAEERATLVEMLNSLKTATIE